jgi:uncharacterized RDD family membrane protein YckC
MPENIIIVNYASFFSRLLAYFIDMFSICFFIYFIAFILGYDVTDFYISGEEEVWSYRFFMHSPSWNYWAFLTWLVYSIIMDRSKYQATHGKLLMKLKVSNDSGHRISLQQSLMRNLFKIISMFPFALGFIWIILNKQNKGWHDIVANTLVLKERKGLEFKNGENR